LTFPELSFLVSNLLSKGRNVRIVRMRDFLAGIVPNHSRNGFMDASAHRLSNIAKRAGGSVAGSNT
jgi:hypothetical protein